MIKWAMLGAILLAASPAAAVGYQFVFDLEDQTVGATALALGILPTNFGSGGTIVTSAGAHSGSLVYRGTTLDFVVEDEIDYDWPAIAAYITGADTVTLTGWHYDPDLQEEIFSGSTFVGPGSVDALLELGTEAMPVGVTRWRFASTSEFTLDDLTVGLVNVPNGIPEPAAWGLMIAGFGVVGGTMRRRRAVSVTAVRRPIRSI